MRRKNSLSSDVTDRIRVFALSALFGALLFVMIYGPYVLNPFYDGWIFMTGERDLPQHYLGFCLYRSSPWQFPIGLVTTASFPHDMSVIYTDAIPLFAFLGKLLSGAISMTYEKKMPTKQGFYSWFQEKKDPYLVAQYRYLFFEIDKYCNRTKAIGAGLFDPLSQERVLQIQRG